MSQCGSRFPVALENVSSQDLTLSPRDYFYPVRLGPLKKAAGSLFDALGRRMARKRTG